uniref:NADH-ubiquinone oxidoreductase chain 2 n=1 Tax=Pseudeuphausia sinica TaxID=296748 RepID=A0A5Q2MVG3_9EUCA|nr:NADH dehydrogenase subunit 2 [Pseudeuphausia sinica]QGG46167.1 NADH dehydrogenase subunit 2 [Pseudeuphausia sinica]
MVFSPSRCLFTSTLILGITIAVSSSSWLGAWMGLELNLLSFIPLILMKDNQYSSEAALKYFLIQALGSTVLLISAVMILIKIDMFTASLTSALLLKAGAAPFHSWFPPTLEGMMWSQALMLMTIQKIAPMSLLSFYIKEQEILVSMSVILSAIVGALGGLNQTFLRKLLAYSSINHMAWMMSALMMSESAWVLYFVVYSLVNMSVVMLMMVSQSYHFNHLVKFTSHKPATKMIMSMSLLSLGGLPPFTGFIPKWMIIQQLCSMKMFLILGFLLTSSLFTLFYYLRMTMSSLVLSSFKTKWNLNFKHFNNKIIFMSLSVNLMGLILISLASMVMT